jgi:hypothetical protein
MPVTTKSCKFSHPTARVGSAPVGDKKKAASSSSKPIKIRPESVKSEKVVKSKKEQQPQACTTIAMREDLLDENLSRLEQSVREIEQMHEELARSYEEQDAELAEIQELLRDTGEDRQPTVELEPFYIFQRLTYI